MLDFNHVQNNKVNNIGIAFEKISKVIEYTKKYCDLNKEKYQDALYAFRWLLNSLSSFDGHKMRKLTKKQRTHAIEVLTEFVEQNNSNKKEVNDIKACAEWLKAKIQSEKTKFTGDLNE